ncbi:MAG: orotate phosphoribosyltransferase [Planctomycetota bacterium]|nr:orotate phosphoribosyltransferase [Planctomycetota bacterium]
MMPDPREAILETFREAGALLEGHFLLSSGLHSPKYLQCALVLQDPARAERLCGRLARAFADDRVETVVGPAMGGILVAYELARALGATAIFAEREEGRMRLRRGFRIEPGQRVLLAEDVVTTGGSLREVLAIVREAEAEVVGVAALVDRTSGRDPAFGMPLTALVQLDVPTHVPEECPLCREGVPVVKPGSRTAAGRKG